MSKLLQKLRIFQRDLERLAYHNTVRRILSLSREGRFSGVHNQQKCYTVTAQKK